MALNEEKLTDELRKYVAAWRTGGQNASHPDGGWVNRWVEAARASAYACGHVDAIVYPVLLVAIFVLGVLLGAT